MNLKSFPGPQPHIRVGVEEEGLAVMEGLLGQTFFWGAPPCQCGGGPLPQKFPGLVLLQGRWGQGAPAACLPACPPPSL